MIGTSKMRFEKELKSKLRYSDFMKDPHKGMDGNALDDTFNFQVTKDFMTDAYRINDWIRAIVDTTTERVDQFDLFPMPLETKAGTVESEISDATKRRMEDVMNLLLRPNDDNESFSSLKKKMVKDLAIYDEAGMQIIKGVNMLNKRKPFALYANITGEELYVNPNKDGTLPETEAFLQMRGNSKISAWGKFEFINFIKNRRAGYANGLSPIETVAVSIMGDIEAMVYNLKFFENNAMPNLAFIFENLGFGKGTNALERAKKWYLEQHQGKPHLPVFMGSEKGTVKLQEMRITQKDMEFSSWANLLLSRIMAVYGMQPFVLGVITDTTGKLNSELQSEQFKRNGIIPYVNVLTNAINSTLIWSEQNFGYDDIYLTSVNLDIDDEKKQAEIDEKYLEKGVITINQVRRNLQMPPVPWGDEPFVPLNYSPLSVLMDWQKSKIEANLKGGMKAPVDNNVGGDGNIGDGTVIEEPGQSTVKKPVAKEEGLTNRYSALYENSADNYRMLMKNYMFKNFKIPTGLEKMEPSEIKDVLTKMIGDREKILNKTYVFQSSFNGMHSIAKGFDLSWKNILTNR